jgi:uncharacterized cupin superfamily protein
MCAGFKSGTGNGHYLINETAEDVVYLEVGDRTPGDEGSYPDDDLKALIVDGNANLVNMLSITSGSKSRPDSIRSSTTPWR